MRSTLLTLLLTALFAVNAPAQTQKATSQLSALTAADSADLLKIVDVSDTSASANGTDKKITFGNFKASLSLQPLDSDLTSIAALSTTSFGRGLLGETDASTLRLTLGLGGAAILNVGTGAGTVAAGNHTHALSTLSDVSISGTTTTGHVLKWNGSAWAPAADSMASGTNGGTVTSVALTVPSGFSVTGSPITESGTLAIGTTLSGMIKGNGSGLLAAVAGTDYLAPTGSTSITTLGTIATGTWQGSVIAPAYLGTGTSISTKFLRGDGTWQTISGGGDAMTSGNLSQFAATTSAQLAGVLSDESGTGTFVLSSVTDTLDTRLDTVEADVWDIADPGANAFVVWNDTANAVQTATSSVLTQSGGTVKIADVWMIAVSDETTALTTGTAKVTFRAPYAATVTAVRAGLTTVSSSGIPTFDINEAGTTILSTKLTVDASEKTSITAATAAVISDASIADDAEITIDIDVAGTGATGAKVYIYVTH